MRRMVLLFVLLPLFGSVAAAQWLNFPTPGVPRTKDGKPRLDAPAPRMMEGHPDLSGVWEHEPTPVEEMRRLFGPLVDEAAKVDVPGMELGTVHKYAVNILADYTPQTAPMQPETAKAFLQRIAAPPKDDLCDPGVTAIPFPLAGLLSEPIKIVQAPKLTLVLYEVGNSHRQIFTDGRALPKETNLPAYLGYSVGRWDRDTFVVDSIGFNGRSPLDVLGHPHSEQLRITERIRRRDFGHLDVEMTFDDPANYTRPFTIKVPHTLIADEDIFEMYPENEKDCAKIGKN